MSADVGPGDRMLCLRTSSGLRGMTDGVIEGRIYTCDGVCPRDGMCFQHGYGTCAGLSLAEAPLSDPEAPGQYWWAGCIFRKIEPGAPEWASRLLEVDAPARVGGLVEA